MRIRHWGFDTLDLAFFGEFSGVAIEQLEQAKREAEEAGDDVGVSIDAGHGVVAGMIGPSGKRGGFRYSLAIGGESGVMVWIKRPKKTGRGDWAAFVSCRAGFLLQHTDLNDAMAQIRNILFLIGWRPATSEQGHSESVSRADFALDLQASEPVEIDPRAIRTRAKKHVFEVMPAPPATYEGDRITSIRIGSLPGRSIAIYDKTREARQRQKLWWFQRWGLDPKTDKTVWRIEVRFGKEHLRDHDVRTPGELAMRVGGLITQAVDDVRLIHRVDRNVSRCPETPFWARVRERMAWAVSHIARPARPGAVARFCKAQRAAQIEQSIRGQILSLLAIRGLEFSKHDFSVAAEQVKRTFLWDVEDREERYRNKFKHARERYAV